MKAKKMKKIITSVAIVCAALVTQAASVSWEGFDITDINGDAYSGTAILHCVELSSITDTGSIDAGELMGNTITDDLIVGGQDYNFYFTSTDSAGNTYKSETALVSALTVGTAPITFEGAGTWTPAPEPTSGLLLLLGVAGLALKRKRA